jgi:acetylornithine deacetylase/succinyl-diaminopimelate desuccinylase family protein
MSDAPSNVVELLQALIRIPSVNPNGNPGTTEVGEKRCAEYVGKFLENLGAAVEYQEVKPDRPNVIGRFPTNGSGKKRIIFAPHIDTVSVRGMVIDPFSGELSGGKILGRGASDTKGPMAAMLWALREYRDQIAELPFEIWFAGMMGEEAGLDGAAAFVNTLMEMEPDAPKKVFALIGEPTNFEVVHATKGSMWLSLTTRGKAAHASTPESGENAIYKMADIIRVLREEIIPGFDSQKHEALGVPTACVGMIEGGMKTNIVPDLCRMQVDLRTVPGQDVGAIERRLVEVCPDAEFDIWSSDPMFTDPSHTLVEKLTSVGGKLATAPWFCDAALFGKAGIPAVAVGPGSIKQAHTQDEWIAKRELEKGAEYFKRFLGRL